MRPILVFDGDCGMCTTSARLVERRLRRSPEDFDIAPSQRLDLAALGLTQEQCDAALQWVGAEGEVRSGHEAVAQMLRAARWWCRPMGSALLFPGVRRLGAVIYGWVARHRHAFPGGTPTCSLPGTSQQGEP